MKTTGTISDPPRFRCETCQSEATIHIAAIGCHFCESCLKKIDAKIQQQINTKLASVECQIVAIADAHFRRDLPSRLKKFMEEVGELAEAIANSDWVKVAEECGDCEVLLIDICHVAGGCLEDQRAKTLRKLQQRLSNGTLHKPGRND